MLWCCFSEWLIIIMRRQECECKWPWCKEYILFIVGNVIIHHHHYVAIRNAMIVQNLVGVTNISLEKNIKYSLKCEQKVCNNNSRKSALSFRVYHIPKPFFHLFTKFSKIRISHKINPAQIENNSYPLRKWNAVHFAKQI